MKIDRNLIEELLFVFPDIEILGMGKLLLCSLLAVLITSCGSTQNPIVPDPSVPQCAAKPANGLVATFSTKERYFWIAIDNPEGTQQALNAWQSGMTDKIPSAQISCTAADWNCGYDWHQEPTTVRLVDSAIELCDGFPPAGTHGCTDFARNTQGQHCPWGSKLVELRDCRTDKQCPIVGR